MVSFPKRYADTVARLRVPSGFLIVAVFAWFSEPSPRSMVIGVPISLVGLGVRAWAAGCLAKNRELATSGPYAYVRNPLYAGTLLVAAGVVVAARSPWLGLLFGLIFVFVYLPVIQLEEQHLRRLFPEYARYAKEVPALMPRLRPLGSAAPPPELVTASAGPPSVQPASGQPKKLNPFRLSLYLRNQEYQAGAGFAAGMLFLLWKVVTGR